MGRTWWLRSSVALAGMVVAGQAGAQTTAPAESSFNLPAQPLSEALRSVARRAGRDLIVADALVSGRIAPAVTEARTPEQAIDQLLAGSGLRAKLINGTIIIEVASRVGTARPADLVGEEPSEQTIVVTGTNLRGAPPTSPVITIGRKDIERAAPASVEELMRKLPQNVSSGVAQENFAVTGAGADITDHGAGLNLRGLGQRATLTLVNGRRLAPGGTGSFVDVSLIPISAVERVEILTDGASAIYGSDAVGGVVNFLLRRDFDGIDATVRAASTTEGDGEQLLLGLAGGHRWSSGQALLAYEYRREDEILARDRDFTIGLPDPWFLFPRERRHSLYGNLRQQLTPNLQLDLSGFIARRRTERSYAQGGAVLNVNARAEALTKGGTAAITWSIDPLWEIALTGGWSATRDRQRQVRAANGAFVNRYNTRNEVADGELKISGDLFDLPGGTAKVAVGAQIRREHYADLFESPVNPANPERADRTVSSAFGELLVPIVGPGNRRLGLERLLVTGAARLDHYPRFGSSIDPKLGLLWSPLQGLDLRSSYATSFRAPLLSESNGYYNAFLFPAALLYQQPATAPAGVGAVLIGANPDVGPERSRSWTLGADWRPPSLTGFELNLSYYDIRFRDRIALPSQQIVVVGDPSLESIVTRAPAVGLSAGLLTGAGQVFDFSGPGFTSGNATPGDVIVIVDIRTGNTAATRTRGLDLNARYQWTLGSHGFRADLNLNHVFRFADQLTTSSPSIDDLNSPYHPVAWRGRGSLGWSFGPVSADLFVNYVGSYHDRRAAIARRVDSWTTLDLGLGYAFRPAPHPLRLSLNVQNLLDSDPPRLEPEPGFVRDVGYDPVNATGRGRTVALQLRASW